MVIVVARIKVKGKQYEIHVNLDEALKFKAGKGDIMSALDQPSVFYDINKGNLASKADLMDAFSTDNAYEVAKKIITSGEVQKTQDFRDAEKDAKVKQVVDIILRNAVDQNGRPYTAERIKRAIEETHCNIDNRPAEQQMTSIVEKLKTAIPIKIETKKVKVTVPARFTGQVYGLFKDFKESEEWLGNGDLEVILNIPSGMQIDFYDKLNGVTHGAVRSEEVIPKK